MLISTSYNGYATQSLWDVSGIYAQSEDSGRQSPTKSTGVAGDTVSISNEALALFARSQTQSGQEEASAGQTTTQSMRSDGQPGVSFAGGQAMSDGVASDGGVSAGASGGGAGGGGAGAGAGTSSTEDQIQALQSQIAALTSQLGKGGDDAAIQSQITALQVQIAALQAQGT